jgi:hypothetical protein
VAADEGLFGDKLRVGRGCGGAGSGDGRHGLPSTADCRREGREAIGLRSQGERTGDGSASERVSRGCGLW